MKVTALPTDWDLLPLGEVAHVYAGGTPSRAVASYWGGEIPWVTTAEVDAVYITSSRERITTEALSFSAAKIAQPGTLLMAMYGQGKTRGKVAMLRIPSAMNQACAAIEVGTRVDAGYLLYYLSAQYDAIRGMSNSGSQDNLNGDIVKGIPVAVPPMPEQRAIAAVLDDVTGLTKELEGLIAKKRDIKQGMLQELMTGRTRLPGYSGDWHEVRLREAGGTYGGLTGKDKNDFGVGSGLFVTFVEVMAGARLLGLRLERVRVRPGEHQNQVQRGDVLFNGSSETPEEVALAAVIDFDPKPGTFLNSFCFGYRLNDGQRIVPAYLAYFFRSTQGRMAVSALAQGATRYNIAKTKLIELALLLPSIPEQRAIVGVLRDAEKAIEALERRLKSARDVKTGVMQELLTGRTRLPVGAAL